MDDLFPNLRRHEDMIRRLNGPSVQYIRQNEEMLTRLREIAQVFERSRLSIDTSAMAAAPNFNRLVPDPAKTAELSKVMLVGLATPESLRSKIRTGPTNRWLVVLVKTRAAGPPTKGQHRQQGLPY